MFKIQLKDGYKSALSPRETSTAISFIKASFQKNFSKNLNLERITAPLFVTKKSGLNDDLSGVERKVEITFKEMNEPSEVVQSLAKWKRVALSRYGFNLHEGLYTDMNAIRRDDSVDNIHSVFVDQWDWEMVISKEDRNIEFLKDVVRKIVISISETQEEVNSAFPKIQGKIEKNVHFITTQELLEMYPELSSKDRENEIVKKYKTVFLMKIGDDLSNGEPHDGRAPDYDDWALNGDLLVWNDVLDIAFELSSMGIRVDKQSLIYQIEKANATERLKLDYHQAVVNEKLPLTIGGGIGQSRLCMYLLQKLHIGEVQVSVWPKEMLEICAKNNIEIL